MQRHCLARRVALLAEGVDRNSMRCLLLNLPASVALLAEGVDRNRLELSDLPPRYRSPSSQRAWIEILFPVNNLLQRLVALLAEGVDRNKKISPVGGTPSPSPSSQRAWIEIDLFPES